jgi:hypothetical protein
MERYYIAHYLFASYFMVGDLIVRYCMAIKVVIEVASDVASKAIYDQVQRCAGAGAVLFFYHQCQ